MKQNSGIFLVNKPKDITSHDLIQQIKNKFHYKKVGHAGTLDPLATGLMIVLINQATKISNFMLADDKQYQVVIQLFTQTDTLDITGAVVETMTPRKLSKRDIKKVVAKYDGYIYDQYPPIFSAIKVNGKKLYEYARKHQEVEVKPRTVRIKKMVLRGYDAKNHTITLDVMCSKGTYIRSLVNDLARDLDVIGTVKELCRTASGEFRIKDAVSVDKISEQDLISLYDALLLNKQQMIVYHQERDIKQGKPVEFVNLSHEIVFVVNNEKSVLAVYRRAANNLYVCQRGLWEVDDSIPLTDAEKEDM